MQLNFCELVENSKRILCSRKTGVKRYYKRFFSNKLVLNVDLT